MSSESGKLRYIVFTQVPDPSKSHVINEHNPEKKIHLIFPYADTVAFPHIPNYLNNTMIGQIYHNNIAMSTQSIGDKLELNPEEKKGIAPMINAEKYLKGTLEDTVYQLEKHALIDGTDNLSNELKRLIKEEKDPIARKNGYDTMIAKYIDQVAKGEIPVENLLEGKQSM